MPWTLRHSVWDGEGPSDTLLAWSATLGRFVILTDVDSAHQVSTSSDGVTWVDHGAVFGTNTPTGIYGALALNDAAPLFVAGMSFGGGIYTSPDGIVWTSRGNPFSSGVHASGGNFCYSPTLSLWAGGCLLSGGVAGNVMATSPDGITWTGRTTPWDSFQGSCWGIAWSPSLNLFVVVGNSGDAHNACFMSSPDGITWTAHSTIFDGGLMYQVIWSSTFNRFIAIGASIANDYCIGVSTDGVTWTGATNDPYVPPARPKNGECQGIIEANGVVYVTGYSDNSHGGGPTTFSTPDLSTWTDMACPLDGNGYSLAYSPSLQLLCCAGVH